MFLQRHRRPDHSAPGECYTRLLPMRYLSLVRHAVTDWNLEGRVQGGCDIPLSAAGEAQARALRDRFAGETVLLYTSPLSRARTTAALAFPDHTPITDPRLSELNYGVFEGRTLAERQALPEWHAWRLEPFHHAPAGGESYAELTRRVADWFASLPDVPHVVAVTHSGTIQALLTHLLGLPTTPWHKRFYLGQTSVTRLVLDGPHPLLERLNDLAHLSPDLHPAPPAPPAARYAAEPEQEIREP